MKTQAGRDYVGQAGSAVEILIEMEPEDKPDLQASVARWLLTCPGQSPAWHHYHLSIIHLRPIEGVKEPQITREGATHEVLLAALDPKHNPVPEDPNTWVWLRPINYVGQMELPSDEEAKTVIELLAKGVVNGWLWAEPPLSGQLEPWESQLRQLEAHAKGKHHVQ